MVNPHRRPDVPVRTTSELERTKRELQASLALARPGSPTRVPIEAHISAIDTEFAERADNQPDQTTESRNARS